MIRLVEYCLTFNVRNENLPPSWKVLQTRVSHNIRNLGGSYNLQVANIMGRIPKHPADEAAAAQSTATIPGPKTPGDNLVANTPSGHVMDQAPLVLEPEVGTGSDLTVALIPQPLIPALSQSQLATHPGRVQALPEEFPLLARHDGLRNPGIR